MTSKHAYIHLADNGEITNQEHQLILYKKKEKKDQLK